MYIACTSFVVVIIVEGYSSPMATGGATTHLR